MALEMSHIHLGNIITFDKWCTVWWTVKNKIFIQTVKSMKMYHAFTVLDFGENVVDSCKLIYLRGGRKSHAFL